MRTTPQTLNDRAKQIFQAVANNKPADTEAIRRWLDAVSAYETSASPVLLHQWGALLNSLLVTTGKTNAVQADDGRFVASYFRALEDKAVDYVLLSEAPAEQTYDNGYSLGYSLHPWGARPLYKNTRDILMQLTTQPSIPVVANLFSSQQWDGKKMLGLMEACDEALGKKTLTVENYLQASRSLCMAGMANALIYSAWCPPISDLAMYHNAWHFALRSGENGNVQQNAERVSALKAKLPHVPHKELFGLFLNRTLSREDVNVLFPLEAQLLGTKEGLSMLVSIYEQQDKAPAFEHAVALFKEYHPEFASLVEAHLTLYSKGGGVMHLIEPWSHIVDRVQPEAYSLVDLVA